MDDYLKIDGLKFFGKTKDAGYALGKVKAGFAVRLMSWRDHEYCYMKNGRNILDENGKNSLLTVLYLFDQENCFEYQLYAMSEYIKKVIPKAPEVKDKILKKDNDMKMIQFLMKSTDCYDAENELKNGNVIRIDDWPNGEFIYKSKDTGSTCNQEGKPISYEDYYKIFDRNKKIVYEIYAIAQDVKEVKELPTEDFFCTEEEPEISEKKVIPKEPNKDKELNGTKFDEGKLDWSLLPLELVEELVKVLAIGAEKHGADNWRKLDKPNERWFSAMMRHTVSRQKGELIDPDDGLLHSVKMMCNAMFLFNEDLRKMKEENEEK